MTSNQDRLSAIKACLGIFLIFCMATMLGYDQHPAYYYDDETIAVNVIHFMEEHSTLDTNWNNADWSGTWIPYMFDYDQYSFSSWISSQYYLKQVIDLIYKTEPFLLYRHFTLAFHLLTLVLVLYAGWRWMGVRGSLLAGAFFATTPMFMIDTHYVRPETFLALVVSLALFIHVEHERNTTKNSWLDLLSGFIWGVGVTCKISVVPMALLFFLRRWYMTRSIYTVCSWIGGSLIAALLFAPYLFINYEHIISGATALFGQYMSPDNGEIRPTILSKYLLYFVGPVAITAILYSTRHQEPYMRTTSKLVLLSSAFYLAFFSLATFISESNMSHMAGPWSWMFASGMIVMMKQFKKTRLEKTIKILMVSSALLPAGLLSVMIYMYVFSNPGEIQVNVRAHEKTLMQKYDASMIIPAESASIELLENTKPAEITLLRVAMTDCYNHKKTINFLDAHPMLKKVDEIKLPLHFLPCSNKIDTIHFPPGYAYYMSVKAENASGKMN